MLKEHHLDTLTSYCTRCGASRVQIAETGQNCHEGVIAISHIRSRARMNELLKGTEVEQEIGLWRALYEGTVVHRDYTGPWVSS